MDQQPQAAEPRRTAKSVRDYARNARLAIWLQLGVAGLAFFAIVVFSFMIQRSLAELDRVSRQLDEQNKRLGASYVRIATADKATKAVLQATAAIATHEPEQYDRALTSLDAVASDLADSRPELEERVAKDKNNSAAHQTDEEALRQLKDVSASVSSTLASVLFTRPSRSEADLDRAISLETRNLVDKDLNPRQVYTSTIALVTFQCERNNEIEVGRLLSLAFVRAFPETGSDAALPKRCRDMAGVKPPNVATFDPHGADPAFRIDRIFLQITEERDRVWAAQLAQAYCDRGYVVPGIEKVDSAKVKAGGVVIYYFDKQASEAADLAKVVAARQPWRTIPAVRHLTGFDNLDAHTAELWLPASTTAPHMSPAEIEKLKAFTRCEPAVQKPLAEIARAVTQLISSSKADRMTGGQLVANQIRSTHNAAVISALLGVLEGPQLEAMNASGRLNVLYMLNLESGWATRPEKQRLSDALANLDRREISKGVVIGGQTRDCINQLKLKIDGKPGASDRCGGL